MTDTKIIAQIEQLISIGIALSSETDSELLLEKILLGAKSITGADGGTLYKISEDGISVAIIHSDSLKIHQGGSSSIEANLPKLPLYLPNGDKNLGHVVCYAFHNKTVVNIEDVYAENNGFDFSGPKHFDQQYQYRTQSLLTLPLNNHLGEVIGVLQLVNAPSRCDNGIGFDEISQKITAALSSQAAIVLTQQHLIQDLEKMFGSIIKLLATAIDQKSPYTGAHSRRVPVLTMMLAEATHRIDHGLFKDFSLSAADRYELETAAWLHDCGKITTPEAVMDKATKLEGIFDRIHLIETRFEVLKRDCEIALLNQKVSALETGQTLDASAESAYQRAIAKIDADLDFLRRINLGGESMQQHDLDRLQTLQHQQWHQGEALLPLLSDNEVYNLSITRGTLTSEERQIINDHIVATITMLEAIEFPKHLKNVPEFAGGHHERMDGKGYPRGLRREDMSVQARIMGIADVFEALMDPGRPYKKGKKLSEALAILENMKNTGHIDPDLYDVFIEQKVYRHYAEQYVAAEQIDVD